MSCPIDPAVSASSRYIRPLVLSVLRNWLNYSWSLQGFGMLRTYLTRELRLHVWDSRFAAKKVSAIVDRALTRF